VAGPEVPFGNYQYEIYLRGLADERPDLPVTYSALEERARESLSPEAFGYVAGGAGEERTVRANREAFEAWRILPRMLRDVAQRDLSTSVLGTEFPAPAMLAPIGVLGIVHEEAEAAAARAAAEVGIPAALSTSSTRTIEEFAEAMGDTPRWFQLYWPTGQELAASFVSRAEQAGYSAIVVTLDTRLLAWRPRDIEAAYLPFIKGEGIANYTSDPVFRAGLEKPPEEDMQAAIMHWVGQFPNPSLTWDDLAFLRGRTQLPIVLKGVLDPDDVPRAVDAGVDGVIVSNHGGRQVDGAVAALDALPEVVDAAPDDLPVLFDSGIRSGSDIFKALALGAAAVLIGRPYVLGLGLGGAEGARDVIRGLLADFDLTMALSGYTRLGELGRDALRPARR
jgi:isopentenyl diphosphate isomerase/L-lactate dehydrogenase-like FMN-dependent dehydrogenase